MRAVHDFDAVSFSLILFVLNKRSVAGASLLLLGLLPLFPILAIMLQNVGFSQVI